MANPRTFQIQEISAHPGPVPGQGTRREEEVCKYIDVTTCIGCKACEVACVEWNDHPFRETTFDDTYQTMPSTEWNYWNLIKFAEDERDGNLMWLCAKINACTAKIRVVCGPVPLMAPLSSMRMASWIFSRITASAAATASPVVPSIFPNLMRRPRRFTSARFVLTEWARDSNRPALRLVLPAVCTLVRRATWFKSRDYAPGNCAKSRAL